LEMKHEGGLLVSAELSPDGSLLLTIGTQEGCIWCAVSGRKLMQLQDGATAGSFSPDGCLVAGVAFDGIGRLWSTATGKVLKLLPPAADQKTDVSLAVFSKAGLLLLTAAGSAAQLWEAAGAFRPLGPALRGHLDDIRAAAFSPDGALAVTASQDATARLWEAASGLCLRVLRAHSAGLTTVDFSPAGTQCLTASVDGRVCVWQLAAVMAATAPAVAGEEACCVLAAQGGVANAVHFAPDGRSFQLASAWEGLQIFGSASGEEQLRVSGNHGEWVRCAAFSPDGLLIITGAYDGTVRLWSSYSGECLGKLRGHCEAVIAVQIRST
ncbi:unnamed protein product, partial [Polarella glacialis]